MRDRQKTIEALRRLAERPGSPAEGETARRKLRELEAQMPPAPKIPLGYTPLQYERMTRAAAGKKYAQSEADFMANLADFFRGAGYVPRPTPKPAPTTWEDMEGVIRRNIYRRGQGDAD